MGGARQALSERPLCSRNECAAVRRGVVFENTGRFELAEADYRAVIAAAPSDPSAWYNPACPVLWRLFSSSEQCNEQSIVLAVMGAWYEVAQ